MKRTSTRVPFVALALILALASVPLAAQRIILVGQGGQYADIPPAVQAAVPGDVVQVLPGTYSSFALDKGISMVGQGAVLRRPAVYFPGIVVQGVPAGQRAALRGFAGEMGQLMLSIGDSAGLVHVEGMDISVSTTITKSANVELHTVSTGGISVTDSGLLIEHCGVTGGLSITRSQVVAAESSISGGVFWPAISLAGGQLTVAGAADTVITSTSSFRMPAISITEGELTLAPQVTLVSTGGAPPVQGGQVTLRTVPSLRAHLAGRLLQGRVHAPNAALALTLVSVAPLAPVPTSVGPFWLEPTAFVVDVGPVSGSFRNLSVPFPPGTPPWLTVAAQSLAVTTSASVELSMPALFMLE